MIIDVFTYYNEKELLEFHINHVYDLVDKIIVIEGDRTFAGKSYQSLVKLTDRKIEHYIVPLLARPVNRWQNEALQRRLAGDIAKCYDGTMFFESVDEIIRPEYYLPFNQPVCFSLSNYYYYFNGKDVGDNPVHPMPIATPTYMILDLQAQWEQRHSWQTIPNAGWHFSYLGGIDRIKQKLSAYSHVENDTNEVKAALRKNIKAGKDIFGRPDHRFEFVPIDQSFPEELVKRQDHYKKLIWHPN